MDSSYLTSQVATIVGSLHGLFDDIGVAPHDRETREAALYAALSETLQNQLRLVAAEKNALIEEANKTILSIKQMYQSLDDKGRDSGTSIRDDADHEDLKITFPLVACVENLKEQHTMVNKLYTQRFEQVKKLVHALNTYAQQMETGFVKIALPSLTAPSPTFKMGQSYVQALDTEFSRVYEEFTKRMATVQSLSSEIVQLWAELGTPSAQTDQSIVDNCRGSEANIGVRENDLTRLRNIKEKLINEKKSREDKVVELKAQVQHLWERLGCDEGDSKAFFGSHRGCGLRVIQEWEQELARLNEIKKANLHIFVEDARQILQDLWENLYYSEDEMFEFEPAFSDVYTDALLEAHEMEIARLQTVLEERAPILEMVEKYQTLVNDRASLEASSQDSSRLMSRGGVGAPRDPTRLLREEKMRKRIAKELPKVQSELVRALEDWEEDCGRPFNINGFPFLDTFVENQRPAKAALSSSVGVGSKNPLSKPSQAKTPTAKTVPKPAFNTLPRAASKTPTTARNMNNQRLATKSPTPFSRPPLGQLAQGRESPERKPAANGRKTPVNSCGRKTPTSGGKTPTGTIGRSMPAYMLQSASQKLQNAMGPPKMRALEMPPPPLRPYDRNQYAQETESYTPEETPSNGYLSHYAQRELQPANTIGRVTSGTSTTSGATGTSSENWETFGEDSEDEPDARQSYYEKLRAAKGAGKRGMEQSHYPAGNKKSRGILTGNARNGMMPEMKVEEEGWSDEGF